MTDMVRIVSRSLAQSATALATALPEDLSAEARTAAADFKRTPRTGSAGRDDIFYVKTVAVPYAALVASGECHPTAALGVRPQSVPQDDEQSGRRDTRQRSARAAHRAGCRWG
jgi:hypothetical protein